MPIKIRRALVVVAMLAGVAGCTVPGPAPVEPRTRPVAPAQRAPAPPPVAIPPPAPPPVAATAPRPGAEPSAPVIQSVPVRPSSVQSRALGVPEPRAAVPPSLVRSEPRGGKLPYSDSAYAEMRASAPPPKPEVPPRPEASPARPEAAPPSQPEAVATAPQTAPPAASAGDAKGFAWPARGRILQGFSEPTSMGISIGGNLGEPVTAAASGRVIFSGIGPRGYGNLVIVKHDADTLSVYAHNRTLLVKEGDNVTRGQRIAELGDSGTDRPKLHFEIRKSGKPVDPQKFLPSR